MNKYFIVSDVHSFYFQLMAALDDKGFSIDNPNHHLVVCGDLFDRGNHSVALFIFIRKLIDENRCVYIRGNHEDLLLECFEDIRRGSISNHHFSNGTMDTISHFVGCSIYDFLSNSYDKNIFETVAKQLTDFINTHCVNYYELDQLIFTHGWIPCTDDKLPAYYQLGRKHIYMPDWRNATSKQWYDSRWVNGMDMWAEGIREPDKIIVCGHWHTSYGHANYHNDGTEWGNHSARFDMFFDDGIIAIDGCTARSGIVNCLVVESEN